MRSVTFTRTFSAAHRLHLDDSKCKNIHGHNYEVEVTITSNTVDERGFIISFEKIKGIIDQYDHTLILAEDDPVVDVLFRQFTSLRIVKFSPSTENFAEHLLRQIFAEVPADSTIVLRLRETDGIEATVTSG